MQCQHQTVHSSSSSAIASSSETESALYTTLHVCLCELMCAYACNRKCVCTSVCIYWKCIHTCIKYIWTEVWIKLPEVPAYILKLYILRPLLRGSWHYILHNAMHHIRIYAYIRERRYTLLIWNIQHISPYVFVCGLTPSHFNTRSSCAQRSCTQNPMFTNHNVSCAPQDYLKLYANFVTFFRLSTYIYNIVNIHFRDM